MAREKEKYHKNTASVWKRLGSFIADAVFFIVLNMALYSFAIFPLTKNITKYNEYETQENLAYEECKAILKDSHLLSFDGEGNEISIESHFKNYLNYLLKDEIQDESGKYYDVYLHFYVTYNNENMKFNGESKIHDIAYVNNEIYKYKDHLNIFVLREENEQLPLTFTADCANYLKQHLNGSVTAKSQEYYDSYMNLMKEKWDDATNYLSESDAYSKATNEFSINANKIFTILSYSSIVLFTVLFALYYFVIPLLMKKGQTLAKKLLRIGIFNEDHTPIRVSQLATRTILQYIFYFFMVLFTPFFVCGLGFIYLPLFTINGYTFYLFFLAVVTFVFSILAFIYMIININHRAPHDKILGLYVLPDAPEFLDGEDDDRPSNVIDQEQFDRGS